MVLWPNYRNKVAAGIGAQNEKVRLPAVWQIFKLLLIHICRTSVTPYFFNVSMGWELDKYNGKSGVHAIRILHLFCSLSKLFYTAILCLGQRPPEPQCAHGCIPHRRREGAILVQESLSYRFRRAGISHILAHKDQRNAFGCPSYQQQQQHLRDLVRPQDYHIISHTWS